MALGLPRARIAIILTASVAAAGLLFLGVSTARYGFDRLHASLDATHNATLAAHPERDPAVHAERQKLLASIPHASIAPATIAPARINRSAPLGPVTFAPPPAKRNGKPQTPNAPVSIAKSPFTVGNPSPQDSLDFALHPSHYADPSRIVKTISLAAIPRDSAASSTQSLAAATQSDTPSAAPLTPYENACRLENSRRFVMSLCTDLQGRVWIGSEEDTPGTGGIQCFDPSKPPLEAFTQYTTKDGLGDNNGYAVACDLQGRIWVGHLNHGVSVFNGQKWQNYDVTSRGDASIGGPLGERIFTIKVCPLDGDVWIGTNAGITRYRQAADHWEYYTSAEGLPSDQITAIAFDAQGNIFVGSQCDGLACASRDADCKNWRPLAFLSPNSPRSDGDVELPSDQINDICVLTDGTLCIATTGGLAWSRNNGINWQYCRGIDWRKSASDVLKATGADPITGILSEDYISKLAPGMDGSVYIGHRSKGCEHLINRNGLLTPELQNMPDGSVLSFGLATAKTPPLLLCATYNAGISSIELKGTVQHPPSSESLSPSPLPTEAACPSTADLKAMLERMSIVPPNSEGIPQVYCIEDDWRTQGSWLGRCGRYWCWLAAVGDVGKGYIWGTAPAKLKHGVSVGPNARPGEILRWWISTPFTDNPSALEIPPIALHRSVLEGATNWNLDRQQAEWDDHGEAYPRSFDGPNIELTLQVPSGSFILSVYEWNDDSHRSMANSLRDYRLVVSSTAAQQSSGEPSNSKAESRINYFHGGVYKRFLVTGPNALKIAVRRNHSTNTIVNALMLDSLSEQILGDDMTKEAWAAQLADMDGVLHRWHVSWDAAHRLTLTNHGTSADVAQTILEALPLLTRWNARWWAANHRMIAISLARWYLHQHQGSRPAIGESCAMFQAGLFSMWEQSRKQSRIKTSRELEKSLRWDSISAVESGHGYELIRNFLEEER